MSFFSRVKPTYINLATINNGYDSDTGALTYDAATSPDSFKYAEVNQYLNPSPFSKADDYIVCVERLELSLQGIPFYQSTGTNSEQIEIVDRTATNPNTAELLNIVAYSLSHLCSLLNQIEFTDASNGTVVQFVFSITKEGFISMTTNDNRTYQNFYVVMPRRLNLVLGISTAAQTDTSDTAYSSTPRLDCGDNLRKIIIQSNLLAVSDLSGNSPVPILTDFTPPSTYSTSLNYGVNDALGRGSLSVNIRQRVIYNPYERRFLELISSFKIASINIKAYYEDLDGDIHLIPLPLGGVFDIKLGFYEKA